MSSKTTTVGNGSLRLPLYRNKFFRVYGGPYRQKPIDLVGVKMAAEVKSQDVQIDIPTPDFSVPHMDVLNKGLHKTLDAILRGDPVYVGCMAGRGRTGLMLALLARLFDVQGPVEYVREHYYPHAVETQGQYAFVNNFVFEPALLRKLQKARSILNFRYWFKTELTRAV